MQIVAFGHRSSVGKDTSAKFLDTELRVRKPGIKIKKVSFASPLKDVTYRMFSWTGIKPPIHYENHREDRKIIIPALGMDIVQLWVKMGNLIRKEFHPEVWINAALDGNGFDVILISDLRYPNEVDKVRSLGGLIYKINRPDAEIRDTEADNALEGWDGWDGTFTNDAGLKRLNEQMVSLAEELLNGPLR